MNLSYVAREGSVFLRHADELRESFMSKRFLVGFAALAAALTTAAVAAAATFVVYPGHMDSWAFNTTNDSGTGPSLFGAGGGFVTGPGTPPLGSGSAHLFTGTDGGESSQLRNTAYSGVKLSALTKLGYCTYATTNNGQQMPYLSLEISTTGNGVQDDRLFFEPPYQTHASGNPSLPDQGAPVLNTWQCWDALHGGWWANSGDGGLNPGTGVNSLSAYLAVHPNATIVNKVDGLGGVRLLVGFASASDKFDGNVDAFAIGVNGTDTTYDFEAQAPQVGPPTNSDQCKNDGWKQFNNPAFKNQGDCVSYVATKGKNGGNG
jgi:hypothetical protein